MYQKGVEEVLRELNTSRRGLSSSQAESRRQKYGLNVLKEEKKVNPGKILWEQFTSPLVWLLMAAVVISFFLKEMLDVIIIGVIIVLNAILGFVQEYRAERAIEALQKMASLKAKVLRDGKEVQVESSQVVPGDILIVETGDKIPADGRLIEAHGLEAQEASLTGESLPVSKDIRPLPEKTPLADRINLLFATTLVTSGRGRAVVISTGMATEIGKIAKLIEEAKEEMTPLQRKLKQLGRYLTGAVVLIAAIIFAVGILSGNNLTTMFLTALALAVAAIPEGLPAVITISLALGVQKMAKKNALVRKLPSVEALGSVNVICTDKTGTLTHNQMTVTKLWANDKMYSVTGSGYEPEGKFFHDGKPVSPREISRLLSIGVLCNNAEINGVRDRKEVIGDPTEAALLVSGQKAGLNGKTPSREDEIPFSSERKMMTTLHKGGLSCTKGAPDVVINLCDRVLIDGKVHRLDRSKKKEILKWNETFAGEALRVLGFAYKEKVGRKEQAEKDLIFVGLQAMIDPPREEAKESIKTCKEAGIRVIMITGDHLTTAQAIAAQLGIEGRAVSGKDLENLDLEAEIHEIGIFARVNPQHKLEIVKALKKKGYVVAMTGDGVNDAPALKKADIGIAMGLTGTDVAKEASDIILADDNFASIVRAVEEGRGIFDNIRKFVNYLLSSNLGEVLVIFLATLLSLPLPLTAIHILWINLVTDGFPAIALGMDPREEKVMKRPPRKPKENIISRDVLFNIVLMGSLIGIFTLVLFWLYHGSPLIKAQTMAFTTLVVFEVVRLQMIRSQYQLGLFSNKYLLVAVLISLSMQMAVLYTPMNQIFGVVPVDLVDWIWIAGGAMGLILVSQGMATVREREEKRLTSIKKPNPHNPPGFP